MISSPVRALKDLAGQKNDFGLSDGARQADQKILLRHGPETSGKGLKPRKEAQNLNSRLILSAGVIVAGPNSSER